MRVARTQDFVMSRDTVSGFGAGVGRKCGSEAASELPPGAAGAAQSLAQSLAARDAGLLLYDGVRSMPGWAESVFQMRVDVGILY